MKKAAVIIGVDKTGDLPVLQAAASGAAKFAQWALGERFEVELITDQGANPVHVARIKTAVRKFVDARTYSQLVVYFSGHGILRGPDYELWLLSDAPGDPNEAVVVPSSITYARNCGIDHVVFVSDACRSIPATPLLSGVMGSTIFPNHAPPVSRPEVDVFYATLPGDPAYEVSAAEAVNRYRGLFTECMLEGLTKQPPEVMEQRVAPPPQCWIIPAWTLKKYLEKQVVDAAAAVSIQLVQNPDIRVESHLPKCLVECPAYRPSAVTGAPPTPPTPPRPPAKPPGVLEMIDVLPDDARGLQTATGLPAVMLQRRGLKEGVEQLLNAKGREAFETRTGFTVVGAGVKRVTAGGMAVDSFVENGSNQLRVHWNGPPRPGRSLLVQFDSGTGAVLAVLSGFIGTVAVDRAGRVVNVSYLPSRGTEAYAEYQALSGKIEKRQAYVAAAARNGAFRIDPADAAKAADDLRVFKRIDPTLGLYAAYAYVQVGASSHVKSVCEYMFQAPEPVPFDVALLASELPREKELVRMDSISPFCPMLTQGWAMMEPYATRLPAEVRAARQHLLPALWTTFAHEGVETLWQGVEKGTLA